jgi:hypothetical protein
MKILNQNEGTCINKPKTYSHVSKYLTVAAGTPCDREIKSQKDGSSEVALMSPRQKGGVVLPALWGIQE